MADMDDTQDLLRISSRIERVQMAKLLITQGKLEQALAMLEKLKDQYDHDHPARPQVVELIGEVREKLESESEPESESKPEPEAEPEADSKPESE